MIAEPLGAAALVEAWLFGVLSDDLALSGLVGGNIYASEAPGEADYPLIAFSGLGGVDTTAPGFRRVLTTLRYAVHCADRKGSILTLDQIAARVDVLLHGGTYDWPGGARLMSCIREGPTIVADVQAGVQTREITQVYTLQIVEASAA